MELNITYANLGDSHGAASYAIPIKSLPGAKEKYMRHPDFDHEMGAGRHCCMGVIWSMTFL